MAHTQTCVVNSYVRPCDVIFENTEENKLVKSASKISKKDKPKVWNVFRHRFNQEDIEVYNVFNHIDFKNDVEKHLKQCKTKEEFAEKLKKKMFYYFGFKCEYEVVVTPFPWYTTVEGYNKLTDEIKEYEERYGKKPRVLHPDLDVAVKVDINMQLRMNFDRFLDYLWSFK